MRSHSSKAGTPIRVAIVGGGCAGVATAFWLTAPDLGGRFEVTLFTQGWRLGGKCASGRMSGANDRIIEHGLHLWLGCYENAFRMMRHCFQEYAPPPPRGAAAGGFLNAFLPVNDFTLAETYPPNSSRRLYWPIHLDGQPGEPGDAPASLRTNIISLANALEKGLDENLSEYVGQDQYKDALDTLRRAAGSNLHSDGIEASKKLKSVNTRLTAAIQFQTKLLSAGAPSRIEDDQRRAAILVILGLTTAAGLAAEVLGTSGMSLDEALNALNEHDLRGWLSGWGAADWAVKSAPMQAVYDLTFAYPDGDTSQDGALAAGVAIRAVLDLAFASYGAPFWKTVVGHGRHGLRASLQGSVVARRLHPVLPSSRRRQGARSRRAKQRQVAHLPAPGEACRHRLRSVRPDRRARLLAAGAGLEPARRRSGDEGERRRIRTHSGTTRANSATSPAAGTAIPSTSWCSPSRPRRSITRPTASRIRLAQNAVGEQVGLHPIVPILGDARYRRYGLERSNPGDESHRAVRDVVRHVASARGRDMDRRARAAIAALFLRPAVHTRSGHGAGSASCLLRSPAGWPEAPPIFGPVSAGTSLLSSISGSNPTASPRNSMCRCRQDRSARGSSPTGGATTISTLPATGP